MIDPRVETQEDTITSREVLFYSVGIFLSFFIGNLFLGVLFLIIMAAMLSREEKVQAPRFPEEKFFGYAGFWIRSKSLLIDVGFYIALIDLAFLIFRKAYFEKIIEIPLSFFATVLFVYLQKKFGQSIGKLVTGIQIVRTDFQPIGWKEIFLRNIVDWFDTFAGWLKVVFVVCGVMAVDLSFSSSLDQTGILSDTLQKISSKFQDFYRVWLLSEMIVLLTNRRRRALHDFVAGTVVVEKRKKPNISLFSSSMAVASVLCIGLNFYIYIENKFYFDQNNAKDGNGIHLRELGKDYFNGTPDSPKNLEKAFQWFQKGAEKNDREAQYYLGLMYENGDFVKVDKNEAIKWYGLSEKQSYKKAKEALARLKK